MKFHILAFLALISSYQLAVAATAGASSEQKTLDRSVQKAVSDLKNATKIQYASKAHREMHLLFDIYKNDPSVHSHSSLCKSLEALSNSDLALFEQDINEAAGSHNFESCTASIEAKIAAHWDQQVSSLPQKDFLTEVLSFFPEHFEVVKMPVDMSHPGAYHWNNYQHKQITLTFDDGPHPKYTQVILSTLAKFGAKALFFELGVNADQHPELSRQVIEEGHSLGSHSYDHPNLRKFSFSSAKKEIVDGHLSVFKATGVIFPFFRFPYGNDTSDLKDFLTESQVDSFLWNIDSLDWKTPDVNELISNVKDLINEEGKGVLLMHDIQKQTSLALPSILQYLIDNNYQIVLPVLHDSESHLLSEDPPIVRDHRSKE